MPDSHPVRWIVLFLCGALSVLGCTGSTDGPQGETGSLSVDLVLADGIEIDEVGWQITGNGMDMSGAIDVSAPGSTASVEVFGLPPGETDYTVTLTAESTDEQVTCRGSADFNVEVGKTETVMVVLNCKLPRRLGGVRVNGKFNICAELIKAVVSPLQTSVGNNIDVSAQAVDQEGDPITFSWTGSGGSFADASAAATTYTCEDIGDHEISISVTDNDEYCDMATWTVPVTCVAGDGGTGGSGGDGGGGAGGEAGAGGAGGGIDPDLVCNTNNCQTSSALQAQCVAAVLVCLEENPDAGEEEECVITAIAICNNDCAGGGDCGDNNECTADLCVDGACSNPPVMDGNACDNMMGTCQSGVCVPAGDLCEGKDCSDNNECTQDICDSETGECSNPPAMDGTSCTCPVCGAEGVCMMGECVDPCEGVDCSDGNQCTADLCDLGVCSNPTLGPGAECDQNGGVVCDGSGSCVECNDADQCPGGGECQVAACESNSCGLANAVDGTTCGEGGSCTNGECIVAPPQLVVEAGSGSTQWDLTCTVVGTVTVILDPTLITLVATSDGTGNVDFAYDLTATSFLLGGVANATNILQLTADTAITNATPATSTTGLLPGVPDLTIESFLRDDAPLPPNTLVLAANPPTVNNILGEQIPPALEIDAANVVPNSDATTVDFNWSGSFFLQVSAAGGALIVDVNEDVCAVDSAGADVELGVTQLP